MNRVVITGLSIHTSLGDSLEIFLDNLLAGKSGIQKLKDPELLQSLCKIGGEIWPFDIEEKLTACEKIIPPALAPAMGKKLRKLVTLAPWATKVSALLLIRAWKDAGLFEENARAQIDPLKIASIGAGHNIHMHYLYNNSIQFTKAPNFIDPFHALHGLDTDTFTTLSELIGARGGTYSLGAACASGNLALRSAVDEIRHHGIDVAIVTGAPCDFSPADLHSMGLMGALSIKKFNDHPKKASRPFDADRDGFVPAQGGGVIILENLESAKKRNAKIYAEILEIETSCDANHLPVPSEEGQYQTLRKLFDRSRTDPKQVDFISAHATSTPLGDLSEIRAIERFFGPHAKNIKINAPKSMLGHTLWSAPIVELIAGILQMRKGILHPSINIENLDPAIKLDVCANQACPFESKLMINHAFGFGGINSACLVKNWSD